MTQTQVLEQKRWRLEEGFLWNENDEILATLSMDLASEDKQILKFAPRAMALVLSFVDNVNSGNYKPRTMVKEFEKLIEQFNEE